MTRYILAAALCLLTAARAQVIVGPAAGSTALTLPASTPATVSDSWLTLTPGGITYTANSNPNARIATITAAGVQYPIVQVSATGAYTPWGAIPANYITSLTNLTEPGALATNANGDLFFIHKPTHRVLKLSAANGLTSVIAGTGDSGYNGDGISANTAQLASPSGIALDPAGNLFIADTRNNRIRKVDAATGLISSLPASLYFPIDVAIAPTGDLFVPDALNHQVLKITANGAVTTVAGNGSRGFAGDGGPATSAILDFPSNLALDRAGNLFISDLDNRRIRRVDALSGIITTVAGNGRQGFSGDGGPAVNAQLSGPGGLALSSDGLLLYIADTINGRIRRVNLATGRIETVAGFGTPGFGDLSGDDGPATNAGLAGPTHVALDPAGNLFIAGQRLRFVDRTSPSLFFGTPADWLSATGGEASLPVTSNPPNALWFASTAAPWLTVTQSPNQVTYAYAPNPGTSPRRAVIRLNGQPLVLTQAATPASLSATSAIVTADAATATLSLTTAANWTATSSSPWLTVSPATGAGSATITYTATANPFTGARTATLSIAGQTFTLTQASASGAYTPWGPAGRGIITTAFTPNEFSFPPYGVAVDARGNIVYADQPTHTVRRIDASSHTVTIIAGTGVPGKTGDGGPASLAQLSAPYALSFDAAGNLYIADTGNSRIRTISAATGIIDTVLDEKVLRLPLGVTARNGYVYIADTGNNRILRLDPFGDFAAYSYLKQPRDPSDDVSFNGPYGIAADPAGNVYFTDHFNSRLRKVDASFRFHTTLAGPTQLSYPRGLAIDPAGNLFIADYLGHRILKLAPNATQLTTVAGTGVLGYAGDGGPATSAQLNGPIDVAADANGTLYIADSANRAIRVVDNASPSFTFTPPSAVLPIAAGSGSVAVSASAPAPFWNPVSSASWLTATRDGLTVKYTFTQNTTFLPRSAAITVAGAVFTVTQQPVAAALSASGTTVPATAGTASFSVILSTAARWSATASADWVTLPRPSGLGTNAVPFTFTANPSPRARLATIAVAGQLFTVTQAAASGAVNPWGRTLMGDADTIATLPFPSSSLAVDANGNIYFESPNDGSVRQLSAATGQLSSIATGLTTPIRLAAGPAGNLYIADGANKGVLSYSPATGKLATTPVAIFGPDSLACDRFGNLYLADRRDNSLRRYDAETGRIDVLSGVGTPASMATDADGNLLLADPQDTRILRRDALSGTLSTALSGLAAPTLVAVSRAGDIFFAERDSADVRRFSPATGRIDTMPFYGRPSALAVDAAGNLYIADANTPRIVFVDLTSPDLSVPPAITAVAPTVATATDTQTFTVSVQDLNGTPDITRLDFLLDTTPIPSAAACQGYYDRATNAVTATGCQATLSNVTPVAKTLSLNLTIARRGASLAGTRKLYLRATDAAGGSSGWVLAATWTPLPPSPTVLTVSPATANTAGPGAAFTFSASDPNGYTDIGRIEFLVAPSPTATGCHGYYDQPANTVTIDDGPCAASLLSATADGPNLTVTIALTRQGALATGDYNLYARVEGEWQLASTWRIGGDLTRSFAIPAPNADRVYFLLSFIPLIQQYGCHGYWNRATGAVLVYDDQLTAPLSFSNSQCSAALLAVTGEGPDQVITLALTRKGLTATTLVNLYTWVVEGAGPGTGWQLHSVWAPPGATVSTRTFEIPAPNADRLYFLLAAEPALSLNTCHGFWDKATNRANLFDDTLSFPNGSRNSRCDIPLVTVTGSGPDLTVKLTITRLNGFAQQSQNLYTLITGGPNADKDWRLAATWNQ